MPITRDADFPAEMATLMAAMNSCCEGHSLEAVEQAAMNMFSAAIHNGARMRGITDKQYPRYVQNMVESAAMNAFQNWHRQAQAADVPVKNN